MVGVEQTRDLALLLVPISIAVVPIENARRCGRKTHMKKDMKAGRGEGGSARGPLQVRCRRRLREKAKMLPKITDSHSLCLVGTSCKETTQARLWYTRVEELECFKARPLSRFHRDSGGVEFVCRPSLSLALSEKDTRQPSASSRPIEYLRACTTCLPPYSLKLLPACLSCPNNPTGVLHSHQL